MFAVGVRHAPNVLAGAGGGALLSPLVKGDVLYELLLVLVGIAVLGSVLVPQWLSDRPFSTPILYVVFGVVVFSLPLLPTVDPVEQTGLSRRLSELVVIVALTSAGLKLDRMPSLRGWTVTWRLLGITMPVTIGAIALVGWGALGLLAPSALLLGAVLAPTDPVLASDVQVGGPGVGEEDIGPHDGEDEVRFALTSEAALNDGLAFPFTGAAILLATVGLDPTEWLGDWLLIDVGYKILAGLVLGVAVGWVLARVMFVDQPTIELVEAMEGVEALAVTLLAYGVTELVHGYGFVAVFVAALTIRQYERTHDYHDRLHETAETIERLLTGAVLILFGGALADGLLAPLTVPAALAGVAIVVLVRPAAGLLALVGFPRSLAERSVIAFYGVKGAGSFFYLSYALDTAAFAQPRLTWAVVGFVVAVSVALHGVTATPVLDALDRRRAVRDRSTATE